MPQAVMDAEQVVRPRASARKPRRLVKILFCCTVFLLTGELGTRLYWALHRNAPAWGANTFWYAYYPELRSSGVDDAFVRNDDDTYDILILGGSVLSPMFGFDPAGVQAKFESVVGRPVRIFNLAVPAHTSRDSLLKYRRLADKQFDLIIFYHGINDVRMNACPPEVFRADYTHASWYRQIERGQNHPVCARSMLAFTLMLTADRLAESRQVGWAIPRNEPRASWLEHGAQVKSRQSLHDNLSEILTRAAGKQERVALMTFAHHVPANYSLEAFRAKQLDYTMHLCPVEIWGKPEHVLKGLAEHNAVVRDLAALHSQVVFVDQHALLPKSAKVFADCCHLTGEGSGLFLDNLVRALAKSCCK